MIEIVIISGPISSGKTTIGKKLQQRLDPNSVFVDIDELVAEIDPDDPNEDAVSRQPAWYLAKEHLAGICKQSSNDGIKFLIVAAPLFTEESINEFTKFLNIDYKLKHFYLMVGLCERIKRMEKREDKNPIDEMVYQTNEIEIMTMDPSIIYVDDEEDTEQVVNTIISHL